MRKHYLLPGHLCFKGAQRCWYLWQWASHGLFSCISGPGIELWAQYVSAESCTLACREARALLHGLQVPFELLRVIATASV